VSGYIYFIMTMADGEDLWKIGYTRNHPEQRLRQLQTGCPLHLELMGFLPADAEDERAIHKKYKAQRVRGEWYDLPDDLGPMMLSACDHYGKILRGEVAR